MLCGLLTPDSGSAVAAGCDIYKETEKIKRQKEESPLNKRKLHCFLYFSF